MPHSLRPKRARHDVKFTSIYPTLRSNASFSHVRLKEALLRRCDALAVEGLIGCCVFIEIILHLDELSLIHI